MRHRIPLLITGLVSCSFIVGAFFVGTDWHTSFAASSTATKAPAQQKVASPSKTPPAYSQKKVTPKRAARPAPKPTKKLPPKAKKTSPAESLLTSIGVITGTNDARVKNGRGTLVENKFLTVAAHARIKDMFEKQYFEHQSPSGVKPADVAEKAGYEYLQFGENIAMGNFGNDQALVDAWLNSPPHRENIMKAQFSEIGVAVERGKLFGKDVWLAVQLFGKPASACPSPDADLKTQIDRGNTDIDTAQEKLTALRAELDTAKPQTNEEIDAYNQKVADHNQLIDDLKARFEKINKLRLEYNTQVDTYNICLEAPA